MLPKKQTLWIALSAAAFSAWAQVNTVEPSPQQDGRIVVTANRFPQPVSSVLAPMSFVTRDDIDRWQSKSLVDVMRRLPGVDWSQNGGLGQKSSLFIRGTNSSHVLILIDGIRLNQAGVSGSSDLSQVPLSLVQRIEYIRGPRSAVYGSDAIGGVVNIITVREQDGTKLTAGGGTHGYQSYDAATQQTWLDTTATLAGNYTYTKGFDVVAKGNTGSEKQPDRDGFMSKALYGAINHAFNENINGFMRGYGYDNRTAYDGYASPIPGSPLVDTHKLYSQTWDSGIGYRQGIYSTQLTGSYSHSKDYDYDPRKGMYHRSASLVDAKQYNGQWGNVLQLGRGTVSAGMDWQQQLLKPDSTTVTKKKSQHDTGLYLTTQQQLGKVTLEGAARRDNYSAFGWHSTWQTSAAWEFTDGYRLLTSYGTAFKAPNMTQLYGRYGSNSHLHPEKSKQWEGGLEGLTGPVTWRVSGYRNIIDNLIDATSGTHYLYYNIEKASIKGIETTASFDTGPLSHHLSYDYVDPRDGRTRAVLLRRAKQQVKYELDWQTYNIDWALSYQYLGQRYDKDYGKWPERRVRLGGVSLWDLAASYPITSHLTVRARIANLLDKTYETAYGYHTARREYYVSGSYAF